jgi:hypothetical protein
MVDNKSSKDDTLVRTTESHDISDTIRENIIKGVDAFEKIQPQYAHSISNLQLDYIQTVKNTVENAISAQKQFASIWNVPVATTAAATSYTEQYARQTSEVINDLTRVADINNHLAINAINAARENLRIYNRTVDAMTEFNTNAVKAWGSYFTAQQQVFKQ